MSLEDIMQQVYKLETYFIPFITGNAIINSTIAIIYYK